LNKTVLHKIIEGLRRIHNGGRFIVALGNDNELKLSFENSLADHEKVCDVPTRLFINGDLKYFAQMLGCEGMSTSWCMWCQIHPSQWKGLVSVPVNELWTVTKQQQFVQQINSGILREAGIKEV
jgi:hypothetical protein